MSYSLSTHNLWLCPLRPPAVHSIVPKGAGVTGNELAACGVRLHPGLHGRPSGLGYGEPRPPPTIGSPSSLRQASEVASTGPRIVGLAIPAVEGLAISPRHRPARHGHPVAPPGIQALLEVEVAEEDRSAQDQRRGSRPDPTHVPREPNVECSSDPIRAASARLPYATRYCTAPADSPAPGGS